MDEELALLKEVLPNEDERLLEALLMQGLQSNDIVELFMMQPELMQEGVAADIMEDEPVYAPAVSGGRPEKSDLIYQGLGLDEEEIYGAVWKAGGKHAEGATRSSGGVIQGEVDGDGDDFETEEEQSKFWKNYKDRWVLPRGGRAEWVSGGRLAAPATTQPVIPEEDLPQPPGAARTDEIALWAQDWEEESDDEELLLARDRLSPYSSVFENRTMDVGTELRKDLPSFYRERAEVLTRLVFAAKEHLEYKEPTGEPIDPPADNSIVMLLDPCSNGGELCCLRFVLANHSHVKVREFDVNGGKDWRLPGKRPDGFEVKLKDVHAKLTPIDWRWRILSCCCIPCPCQCTDQLQTSLTTTFNIKADLELHLHPAHPQDATFYKTHLSLSQFSPTSHRLPRTPPPPSWHALRQPCCCSSLTCGLFSCFYTCIPFFCNPCIKCLIEHYVKQIPELTKKPDKAKGPAGQKMA
eukprot:TRINITY_DN17123_c0_g1_i2.p1 TRINITY_DN17123_c0_g1~~TRINITY_DN17123_c0_g1_i2.p1  ORF type:complete len:499 (+),score=73.18 TRINITY_DN17123_c0_g1_i2:102-1499(+)